MPGLDHKGPQGEGPRTGRQLGNCKPAPDNGEKEESGSELNMGSAFGRGRGLGRGLGRGRGRGPGRGLGRGRN